MPLNENEISALKNQLNNVLDSEHLNDLARETNFIQRKNSKIVPFDFMFLMTLDLLSDPLSPLPELCRRLFKLPSQTKITPQSLSERINSENCVSFFKAVFEEVLYYNRDKLVSPIDSSLLSPFNRVLTEDSTQFQLDPKLSDAFGGSGGSASPAAIKLDLIEDLKHNCIELIELYEGKKNDQSISELIIDLLKKDDLILRDLGYFSVEVFSKIAEKEAFFLSRLLLSVNLYLEISNSEALDLSDYLNQKKYRDLNCIDLDLYMGSKHKLPVRLIAYRLPESTINQRKRKAKDTAKEKGYTLSDKHLKLLEFSIYVTNVPPSTWPAKVVGTIYRLRWQVELTFKRWKSLLKIDYCKGTNPQRIQTLIYSRLIAIVLLHDFYALATYYTKIIHQREISPHKIYQWLLGKQRIANAILNQELALLWEEFTIFTISFCKQKRKRMTILDMIQNEVEFLDSFQRNTIDCGLIDS